jgi:uncharacterized iron-regulated protein
VKFRLPIPPARPAAPAGGRQVLSHERCRFGKGRLLTLLAGVWLLAGACASMEDASLRPHTYAYDVPPERTFDMAEGRELSDARMRERLRRVRLLFLGEHHTSRGSHRFQRDMLELLAGQGRRVTVALEMFPPSADPALEAWRKGELDELEFLEQSGWYRHWGFAWAYYREVFEVIRRHGMPVRGVNVKREEREAARKEGLKALPAALSEEIGPGPPEPEPAALYLYDVLSDGGHARVGKPGSPELSALRRVQWLWDRAMGVRAARLAEQVGPDGIVVVLIGSGHLAYRLGANLQAARESALPQLTIWDTMVRKDSPPEAYRVPLGMADWVRIHERDPEVSPVPSLRGVKLERDPEGARVKSVQLRHGSPWAPLREGDVIRALNGTPVGSPAALRLAFESLSPEGTAELELLRDGAPLKLSLPVTRPSPH